MITNEKQHIASTIASLTKVYNQSRINGKLNSKDIYIVDLIYKLLNSCETSLNQFQKKTLTLLYNNIRRNSKYICQVENYKTYYINNNNKFIQAESSDCNTLPSQDLIYYWQEPLGVIDTVILENIATGTYLDLKTSDLKSSFIDGGKDITYTDIGLICFALNKTKSSFKYKIFDDNDADVTDGFESFYNTNLQTRIFISYNIYSHGIMNFKIIKI